MNGTNHWLLDLTDGRDTAAELDIAYGAAGDRVVTGDWNNDGKTDLGLVRPTAGGQLQWFFRTLEVVPKEWGTVFGQTGDQVLSLRDRVPGAATTPQPPTRAGSVTAANHTRTSCDLTWADASGEAGYEVLLSSDGGLTYRKVGALGANVTKHTVSGLKSYTTYYAKVVSTNAAGRTESAAIRVRTI